ncbi:anamorsin homolog [Lineus longissimus]|uniref:anamorsin homolog n=1 Tax=Lineus longissimus TaxID=88925 RepID=UPI002B4E7B37
MPLAPGQSVLLLWGSSSPPENVQDIVANLQKEVTDTGAIQLEHKDRLLLSSHSGSSFDVIQSGVLPPACVVHTDEVLAELIRILKPDGELLVREAVGIGEKIQTADKLMRVLKLSGFVDISSPSTVQLSESEVPGLKSALGVDTDVKLVEVTSRKPDYELGASTQLKISFAKKAAAPPKVEANAAAVWTLSANDMGDDDIDLVDEEELLDEDDLKKPDPASLRAECGPNSEKKKACKNCTCGFADELEAGKTPKQKTQAAASACGSCYLGDAFRCASCPYLGMPAFKPGEKVSLSNRQLKADA